jgi:DNA gyrase subunit B
VTDDRGDDERVEIFSGEGGIASLVEDLAGDPPLIDPVSISGEGTFQEVVIGRGEERPHTVDRHVGVEIALRWGTGYTTTLRSFVNVVETKGGGTHVTGFERAMVKCFAEAISATRLLKVDESVAKEDVMEGLTAVVVVRLPEPQFEGQTKDALSTNEVQGIVSSAVSAAITSFLVDSKRKADARKAMEKISRATKARLAARMQRDVLRRKTALESSKLPSKLADCRSEDVTRNEILIVEGDSAMGTAKAARDSEFQALLPIRGKILNTWRASEKQMLENIECAAIISALGAGSGPSFTLDNMRYGRFVVLTDADVDGHHIRTLLLTLCWRYMRPLVEAGRAYASVPPLYRVTLSHSGEYLYTYSDEEQAALLARLASEGKKVRDDIQRYKGLGEMSAEQLAETTMYPGKRRLRRVTVADAKLASACFETLMGNDASERRRFIVDKGGIVDPAKLDI